MQMRTMCYDILKTCLPAVALLWVTGCSDVDGGPSRPENPAEGPVTVQASTAPGGNAQDADGHYDGETVPLKGRTMLFTYPSQPDGRMASAYCVFDDKGFGYIYKDKDNPGDPLRWTDIYCGDDRAFPESSENAVFLDNLVDYPVQEAIPDPDKPGWYTQEDNFNRMTMGPQDPETALVKDDTHKYKYRQMIARTGSPKAETADIIWGKISNPVAGKALHFELEHKMAALSFRFYSYDEELTALLKEDVDVWLDRTVIWLDVPAKENDANKTAFVRKEGCTHYRGDIYEQHSTFQDGVYLAYDEKLSLYDPGQETYSTPVWVFPPHKYALNQKTPELSVRLSDGQVYGGSLPQKIEYWLYDGQTWQLVSTTDLRLLKGYHTSFKVLLRRVDGAQEIRFEDVTVEPFAQAVQDDHELELKQNGIYSGDDFMTLAGTYKESSGFDNRRLRRYGRFNEKDEIWEFFCWCRIEFPENSQLPEFGNADFRIVPMSDDYGIYRGGKPVTAEELAGKPQNRG